MSYALQKFSTAAVLCVALLPWLALFAHVVIANLFALLLPLCWYSFPYEGRCWSMYMEINYEVRAIVGYPECRIIGNCFKQPNGRKQVMEILFSKPGYKTFAWILPPTMQEFNPNHSYTVSYMLQVDCAEECMWLTKFYEGKFYS
ncbi:uncharacterized protein LOC130589796 [Beta vulgaris subsp. vulgaris]|uniref:uncharacterized protein LOC130589796 n=1 Tax=Beta vulgaris subsp. vulgaris TaxID=3555 RepID=UPI002548E2EC|nr:uncharacterized protein LOC130589796 [Beta vulgaris subsp. vulgaris]